MIGDASAADKDAAAFTSPLSSLQGGTQQPARRRLVHGDASLPLTRTLLLPAVAIAVWLIAAAALQSRASA